MKCKWKDCENEVSGKALYCSGACRVKQSRSVTKPVVTCPLVTVDGKCYNRQAVACFEFGSRPEPLAPTDQPVPKNRGRYKRADGTVYQFDATGHSFECKHPFKDKESVEHLAVYETVADVRAAGGAWV
jgi:hypothetical protein